MAAKACAALASVLSAKYSTYTPYDESPLRSSPDLPSYLDNNGILLSICFSTKFSARPPFWVPDNECSVPKNEEKLSASWVQENATGWRVFAPTVPSPWNDTETSIYTALLAERGSDAALKQLLHGFAHPNQQDMLTFGVGMILRPWNVRCVYPFDAGTNSRDDYGCGHFKTSQPSLWKKAFWKAFIEFYHRTQFPHKSWTDVPCVDFFQHLLVNQAATLVFANTTDCDDVPLRPSSFRFESAVEINAKGLEQLMGHPVCKLSPDPDVLAPDRFLVFASPCSWEPSRFDEMVSTTRAFINEHPQSLLWNEIVLSKPASLDHGNVQALFFVEDDNQEEALNRHTYLQALKQARKMKMPLMRVKNPTENAGSRDMFECNATFAEENQYLEPASSLRKAAKS